MVISAVARAATRIVSKAKAKKYFATEKAKRIKKATVKRGKDAVKVQKTTATRRIATDDVSDRDPNLYIQEQIQGRPNESTMMKVSGDELQAWVGGSQIHKADVLRRHITKSNAPISPLHITKSEEVSGDPRYFDNIMLDLSQTTKAIASRTSEAPYIRETVVSVKGAPRKLVAYKKKEQGEVGYDFEPSGTTDGGSDHGDYPYRATETVFGVGIGNVPESKAVWGIAQPKRSLEVYKRTQMEDMGNPNSGDPIFTSSHLTGIRTGNPGRATDWRAMGAGAFQNRMGDESKGTVKGLGLERTEIYDPSGESIHNIYTFGTLTKGGNLSKRSFFSIDYTRGSWDIPSEKSKMFMKDKSGKVKEYKATKQYLVGKPFRPDDDQKWENFPPVSGYWKSKDMAPAKFEPVVQPRNKSTKESHIWKAAVAYDSRNFQMQPVRTGVKVEKTMEYVKVGFGIGSKKTRTFTIKNPVRAESTQHWKVSSFPTRGYTAASNILIRDHTKRAFVDVDLEMSPFLTETKYYIGRMRYPSPHTTKKIKRAALPAFAATSAGFILYPGTKKKAKKKKKGGKK